jgi:hypothetical protein
MTARRQGSNSWYDDVITTLRGVLKTKSQTVASGFLAENRLMEALEAAGVFSIRGESICFRWKREECTALTHHSGYESAIVDAILPVRKDRQREERPVWSIHEAWDWVEEESNNPDSPWYFLAIDMKYFSLMRGGLKKLDYAFLNPPFSSHSEETSLYLIMFESEYHYVALVPKGAFDVSTDIQHGILPLTGNVPSWCHSYMVHLRRLREAIQSVLDVDPLQDRWSINPTTGVRFNGWDPKKFDVAPILPGPEQQNQAISFKCLRRLWALLASHGCPVYANPVAPFWTDFLAEFMPGEEAGRGESKFFSKNTSATFEPNKRSPFASGRQWHVLFVTVEGRGHLCVLRHEVQWWWAGLDHIPPELESDDTKWFADSSEGVGRMLDHIRKSFTKALDKVDDIMLHPPADGYDLHEMMSLSSGRLLDEEDVDVDDLRGQVERIHHARGLWWLPPSFNKYLCEVGVGVVVTLDVAHPISSSTIVYHKWTSDEQEAFRESHQLPVTPYSEEHRDAVAVPLQLVDLSVTARGSHVYPIWMRQAYWLLPPNKQKTIIIGSTAKARVMENTHLTPSYAMIPSGITTKHSQGFRAPNPPTGDDAASRYFRKDGVLRHDALPKPSFSTTSTEVKPLKQGSSFFTDSDYNPLRYILPQDTIADRLVDLISGGDDEIVYLQNPQSNSTGLGVVKGEYRTTLRELNQAAWTFGRQCSFLYKLDGQAPN